MKHAKNLGLALAIAALLSLAGASGASAAGTTLCKLSETPCTAANHYGVGTEFAAELTAGTKLQLTISSGTGGFAYECGGARLAAKTETTGSATTPVEAQATEEIFKECSCSIAVLKTGTLVFHHVAGTMNAQTTLKGLEWQITCSLMKCVFAGDITSGLTLEGGSSAHVIASSAQVPTTGESTLLCGKAGAITAEYTVSKPSPLYAAET